MIEGEQSRAELAGRLLLGDVSILTEGTPRRCAGEPRNGCQNGDGVDQNAPGRTQEKVGENDSAESKDGGAAAQTAISRGQAGPGNTSDMDSVFAGEAGAPRSAKPNRTAGVQTPLDIRGQNWMLGERRGI